MVYRQTATGKNSGFPWSGDLASFFQCEHSESVIKASRATIRTCARHPRTSRHVDPTPSEVDCRTGSRRYLLTYFAPDNATAQCFAVTNCRGSTVAQRTPGIKNGSFGRNHV